MASSKGQRPLPPEPGTTRETKLNGYQWLMFKKAHTHQHLSDQHSFVTSFMISIYQHLQIGVPSINPKEWWIDTPEHSDRASRRSAGEALAFRIGLQGSWEAPEMEAHCSAIIYEWIYICNIWMDLISTSNIGFTWF